MLGSYCLILKAGMVSVIGKVSRISFLKGFFWMLSFYSETVVVMTFQICNTVV